MLAPLIIDPLIASLLLLLVGWLSDMVGQLLRHGREPQSRHDSTSRTHDPRAGNWRGVRKSARAIHSGLKPMQTVDDSENGSIRGGDRSRQHSLTQRLYRPRSKSGWHILRSLSSPWA